MGAYVDHLELAAEVNDWGISIRRSTFGGHTGHVESPDFGVLKVIGATSEDAVAALLADQVRRVCPDLCGCLGAGVFPSENGGLSGCTECREPAPNDTTPGDAAVRTAFARSLK